MLLYAENTFINESVGAGGGERRDADGGNTGDSPSSHAVGGGGVADHRGALRTARRSVGGLRRFRAQAVSLRVADGMRRRFSITRWSAFGAVGHGFGCGLDAVCVYMK